MRVRSFMWAMKDMLTDLFTEIEDGFEELRDSFVPTAEVTTPVLQSYLGYTTPTALVARGRVLAPKTQAAREAARGRLGNIRNVLSLFNTRELPGVRVRIGGQDAVSDKEGYVRVELPKPAESPENGLHRVPFGFPDHDAPDGEVLIRASNTNAQFGIISDIDDTVLKTEAWSLKRNIVNSLTGSEDSRIVFPDAKVLLDDLVAGANPLFFVSSSPWNLYGFLQRVFARNGLPHAPKFLRDFGIGEGQLVTGTHGDHKGEAIDTILAARPELPFLLIGDTGQHDADVYADARERHGGRVRGVILRLAGPLDAEDAKAMERLRSLGTPVWRVNDYGRIDRRELHTALA